MADTSEFMDYDAVAAKMVEMKAIFDDYYKILSDLDSDFNYYIYGSSGVGLYSSLGNNLKSKWGRYSSCFGIVKTEFDNWYNAVGETTEGNTALEEAAALYAAQAAAGEGAGDGDTAGSGENSTPVVPKTNAGDQADMFSPRAEVR